MNIKGQNCQKHNYVYNHGMKKLPVAKPISQIDTLIEAIRQEIKAQKLTKAAICRATNLHMNTLRRLCEPDWSPSLHVLRTLERALIHKQPPAPFDRPKSLASSSSQDVL